MELDKLNKAKAILEKELAEIDAQIEASTSEDLINIAEFIHSIQCTWNHTDGCGWYYEKDYNKDDVAKMWAQPTHMSYMRKAKNLMAFPDIIHMPSLDTSTHEHIVTRVLAALKSVW